MALGRSAQICLQLPPCPVDTKAMVGCNGCHATITAADRFCPACGLPNRQARFHPKFGPAPEEPPGPPPRPGAPPSDVPYCPRCWAEVRLSHPFCGSCGMPLDDVRARAELARFGGVWLTPGPDGRPPYRSLRLLTAEVRALASATVVVALLVATSSMLGLIQHRDRFSSFRVDQTDVATFTGRLQWLMAALIVASALAFIVWATRAYRNLPLLAVKGLRIPTRWAWTVWFVPFGNLIWGKELVDDLYRASDPSAPVLSPGWRLRMVPMRVHLWWISVMASGVLLLTAHWMSPSPAGGAEVGGAAQGLIAAAHFSIATAAALTALLVTEVATRQRRRVAHLGVAGPASRSGELASPATPRRSDPEPRVEQVPLLVHADSGSVAGRY